MKTPQTLPACSQAGVISILTAGLAGAAAAAAQGPAGNLGEFDEFDPIVEINATDGDVGFHMLLDGDAWRAATVFDPSWRRIVTGVAAGGLREQGITELFLESAEPLCWNDPEEPDTEVVTVADFVERFRAGTYSAFGWTVDRERLRSTGELTHALPAAPDVAVDTEVDEDGELEVTINWTPGDDLGRCAFDDADIPAPGGVQVVRWEVVVEPDEDAVEQTGLPFGVFSIQLQAHARSVEVPEEFVQAWVDAGITEFKVEVGAKEESGNQTFTEVEFELDGGDD